MSPRALLLIAALAGLALIHTPGEGRGPVFELKDFRP